MNAKPESIQLRHDAAIEGIREFFALLDIVEESDEGRRFHPTTIGSCRALDIPKLEAALRKMRGVVG